MKLVDIYGAVTIHKGGKILVVWEVGPNYQKIVEKIQEMILIHFWTKVQEIGSVSAEYSIQWTTGPMLYGNTTRLDMAKKKVLFHHENASDHSSRIFAAKLLELRATNYSRINCIRSTWTWKNGSGEKISLKRGDESFCTVWKVVFMGGIETL